MKYKNIDYIMTIDENNEIAQGNQTLTSFLKGITGVDPVNNCSTKKFHLLHKLSNT